MQKVIIAHKNARFLALHLELYRNYDDSSWYPRLTFDLN